MKRQMIRYSFWIVLLLAILTLSACGREERQRGINGYIYVAELLSGTENWDNGFKISDNWLYYVYYGYLYRVPLKDGKPIKTTGEKVSGSKGMLDYTVDASGGVYCYKVVPKWQDSGNVELTGGMLVRYREDGSEDYSLSVEGRNAVYPELPGNPEFLAAGSGGQVFLLMGDTVLVVDGEGRIITEIDVSAVRSDVQYGTERLLEGEEGRVYYVSDGVSQRKIFELVSEGSSYRLCALSMKGLEGKETNFGYFYGSRKGMLYNDDNGFLYRYSVQEEAWFEVLRWSDSNLSKTVNELGWISEDRLFAVYQSYGNNRYETEFYLLDRKRVEEVPEREELILACWDMYFNELEDAVIQFNRASSQYHVTIELYREDEGENRLDAELVSSAPPDLLDLSYLDTEKYAGKQALEDLNDYLENSTLLKREDFLEGILDGYTVDGRLAGIPSGFTCYTLMGRASEVGSQAGWTLEDVMALTEKYPGRKLNGRSFHKNLEYFCGEYIMSRFVDSESGACYFDSEEFCSLVQWMGEHSGKLTGYYGLEEVESPLLFEAFAEDVRGFLMFISRSGEDMVSMGYPSIDGSPRYHANMYNAMGIPSKSRNKEGAWKFIEYFLSQGTEETWNRLNMPSRRDLLEKMMEDAVTPEYWMDDGKVSVDRNGNPRMKVKWMGSYWNYENERVEYEYYYATQEEIEDLREMIAHTDFSLRDSMKSNVISIIAEEAGSYFSGGKSLKEAAEIIQNRVSILVQENM